MNVDKKQYQKIIQIIFIIVNQNIYKEQCIIGKVIQVNNLIILLGYVIRIDDYRESLYKYLHHAATCLV